MNKAGINLGVKLAMSWTAFLALALPASGQIWHALGKAAGTPVVVANTACNSSVDTTGITADRSTLLSCQSGVWKQMANGTSVSACSSPKFGYPNFYGAEYSIGAPCQSSTGQILKYAGNDGIGSLIVSANDDPARSWYNGSYLNTGATSVSDGASNTISIITSQGPGLYVAQECANKGPGWFLPAENQLQILYSNRIAIGGFTSSPYYWSSTQYNPNDAAMLSFLHGSWVSLLKNQIYPTRCVRRD